MGFAEGAPQSLRAFLGTLERDDALRRVTEPIDPRFELSARLCAAAGGPALLFEHVIGSRLPAVGNVLNSRARIARGLGVPLAGLSRRMVDAVTRVVPPRRVREAPCQAVAVDAPDLAALPVPTFFEHETGRYVTAGAIVARDPVSGAANLSIARLKLLGGNRAMIGIAPNHHLAVMARAAAAGRTTLDLAVTIGNHPAVLLASCLYLAYGDDELAHAGTLLGEPVEVVRCQSAELDVPAHCEIVLEGVLDPAQIVTEGPVSEYHGMYEDYGAGYVVTVRRLTRRRDAVFQVVEPGHYPEHILLGGVAIAAGLETCVRREVPSVVEVAMPESGSGRLSCVVSLEGARSGDARRVMAAVWGAVSIVKTVTVVDADIDPWDASRVEWARACFVKADRDLVVVPGARADRSEPLERNGVVTKLGIDATRKEGDRVDWRLAAPPPTPG